MLTTWSDAPRELRRALSDAQARPARGLTRLAERRNHDLPLRGSMTARSGDSIRDLGPEDRFFAQQVAGQVERAVSGGVAALRGFAQPPGRKVMLLVAGGWPFSPAAYAANVRTVILDSSVPEGPELMRPLVDTANLLGYTIYPIDAPGLGGGSGTDEGGPGAGSFDREITTEDTLHHLATATGGEALINARRRAPLEHVEADTRSYNWLGVSPPRPGDARRHAIEVEVTRPGLRVRSRDSYRDLSRQAERQMAVESALLFGDPATEGLLPVEVGEARPAGRREVEVPLAIAIPVDFLTLLPVGDPERWVVRLELRVGVLDEKQRQATPPALPVELTFRQRPEAGKHVPYNTTLKLRRAEQVLIVVVTDVASGRSLTARVTVDP
jgi:VWFA-related protein